LGFDSPVRELAIRCDKVGVPVPERLPSWDSPPDPFLGTEDSALSCFPIQDLAKKMLAKDEARL
jgi:hypothetical protein